MNHILIVSPIPSHPQFQGNSARIYRLTRMYQMLGYKVHFVYFGMEGLTPKQEREMRACWDFFHFVQPIGPAAEPSYETYFDIDDWYDQRVSALVEKLCMRYDFSVCLTNYVWFSKVLEVVPQKTQKIIDTHDVFGDRHLVARKAGLEPAWFYTTKELEAFALDRADIVIAIQDEEARYFESITNTPVEVMGYVVPQQQLLTRNPVDEEKIRIGYIGSANPFNVQSIIALQNELLINNEMFSKFEFYLAGTICNSISSVNKVFKIIGKVQELSDFYREIDVAINPMVGGTGLKIKSLEALSYGKPLIGTLDAMVGIEVFDDMQKYESLSDLARGLKLLDSERLAELITNSEKAFNTYNQRFIARFRELFN
ncbi:glycosyltransferase [Aliiglaciecola sp. 3_MG-2023]|uniref:glycosyltransferase n=1 Tax=Aliiglaciecola sp. 3_MG-2023 TaxID=3062644 RepID=UPI0026E2B64F|nr:glycosyltransferase [Aliiglaciecola sp. 3_MG-2023]MDO6691922.1 glycosyltransferase [Aliiglaciecola sp. 3_MG-2023]